MACNCGSKKTGARRWVHEKPDGTKEVYDLELDARTAAARSGGKAYQG